MRSLLVGACSILAVLCMGLYFRYGTVEPCGMLKQALRSQLLESTVEDLSGGVLGGLTLALGGPLIDSMVESLTPAQCIRGLYQLETGDKSELASIASSARKHPQGRLGAAKSPPPPYTPRWRSRTEVSPIDDSTNVYLSIDADSPVSGWLDKNVRPTLNIRCKENTTNVFINLRLRPKVEFGRYGSQSISITLRFNGEKAFVEQFNPSTDGEAAFFPRHLSYVRRMLRHKKLLIRFTPLNAAPQMTTFNLEGLETKIGPLRAACHW